MNRQETDSNNRMRTILQRMERSIDDARSRRVEGTGTSAPYPPRSANPITPQSNMTPRSIDPLDTPIADSLPGKSSKSDSIAAVRDAGTMFDFNGPRPKARPKRPSSD